MSQADGLPAQRPVEDISETTRELIRLEYRIWRGTNNTHPPSLQLWPHLFPCHWSCCFHLKKNKSPNLRWREKQILKFNPLPQKLHHPFQNISFSTCWVRCFHNHTPRSAKKTAANAKTTSFPEVHPKAPASSLFSTQQLSTYFEFGKDKCFFYSLYYKSIESVCLSLPF